MGNFRTTVRNVAKKGGMAITVSLINMMGGVGKATIASQLAHATDRADFRALAIDFDPQPNLSQSLMGPQNYVNHLGDNTLKNPTWGRNGDLPRSWRESAIDTILAS